MECIKAVSGVYWNQAVEVRTRREQRSSGISLDVSRQLWQHAAVRAHMHIHPKAEHSRGRGDSTMRYHISVLFFALQGVPAVR